MSSPMNHEQAFNILFQVTGNLNMNRDQHGQVITALELMKQLLPSETPKLKETPKPKAE